jgi:Ca-activated chloride channel family protein
LNWQFQYTQAFYLLAILPFLVLLYILYRSWRNKNIRKIGDKRLVSLLIASHATKRSVLKFVLVLTAFAAGIITLANPRKPDESSADFRKGIDIVIALDVSNSMLATDIPPNRLARARSFITRLIDQVPNDRVGLVVFAGNAYVQMPLTFDRSAAKMYVATAGPQGVAAQGTSIGDALVKAEIAFGEETERFKSIILISDGETHDEAAVEKLQELAAKGIMINTLGLGSAEGATIIDPATGKPRTDASGQVVISKLNEAILQQLAAATNGIYLPLTSAESAVKQVLDQYRDIEKKALSDTSLFNYKTFYTWFALPMLLLLLIDLIITERKKRKV